MSESRTTLIHNENRLQKIKDRQGLLRARSKDHSWRNILKEADLNYNSIMVQFHHNAVVSKKLTRIEQELARREAIENIKTL